MDRENIDEEMFPFALSKLNDPELIRRCVEEGKNFQDILGYSDTEMDEFYQIAYKLLEGHRYSEATDAFLFLTTLNPFSSDYWLGMGVCEQINQNYSQALVAYSMTIIGSNHQPIAHYRSAACHHALGDTRAALRALDKAIEGATEWEGYDQILSDALRSKERLLSSM